MSKYKRFKDTAIDKLKGLPVDKETFCPLPFTHISTMPHGEVKLCCRGQPPAGGRNPYVNDPEFDLKEYWNSEYLNDIRDDLIMGTKIPQCKNCWKMEDQEIVSLRLNRITDLMENPVMLSNVKQYLMERKVDFKIPLIELKLSNVCNFKCRMCWPKDSSKWMQDWNKLKNFYNENDESYINDIVEENNMNTTRVMNLFEKDEMFISQLLGLMEHVEEIEFAGGEPLMDPVHYRVLESIPNPENVTLKYSTNLSIMKLGKKHVIDIWKKFKSIKLTISIDGHEPLNAKIRRGADWQLLKSNIELVKSNLDNIDVIKGTTCISAMNALYLAETADAIINDLGIHWHTSRLQWPNFLCANVLPKKELKEAVNKLLQYKETVPDRIHIGRTRMFHTHIDGAVNWLTNCYDNNKYNEEIYKKYVDFNNKIDEIDNE